MLARQEKPGAKMILPLTMLAVSTFTALPERAQSALERCGVTPEALEVYLGMDQHAFDQDLEGGWRRVAMKERCGRAGAELIRAYILYSRPAAPEHHSILRWHAGQALASAGDEAGALPFFRGSYHQGPEDPDEWDLYVSATIAFVEGDRDALIAARDALAAMPVSEEKKAARRRFLEENPDITMPDGYVDEPQNLSVVEGLVRCFGRPYADAYGGGRC